MDPYKYKVPAQVKVSDFFKEHTLSQWSTTNYISWIWTHSPFSKLETVKRSYHNDLEVIRTQPNIPKDVLSLIPCAKKNKVSSGNVISLKILQYSLSSCHRESENTKTRFLLCIIITTFTVMKQYLQDQYKTL